jgi:hypothetical protein
VAGRIEFYLGFAGSGHTLLRRDGVGCVWLLGSLLSILIPAPAFSPSLAFAAAQEIAMLPRITFVVGQRLQGCEAFWMISVGAHVAPFAFTAENVAWLAGVD